MRTTTNGIVNTMTQSFRPLSWGHFFNYPSKSRYTERNAHCFRPLSRGLFFNNSECTPKPILGSVVFVPFLEDFFSIEIFRNANIDPNDFVFVPFLEDFFSIHQTWMLSQRRACFRPLSRGLFFNRYRKERFIMENQKVFVPFLGDFFSIRIHCIE